MTVDVSAQSLTKLDDQNFRRILVVVAHPDDAEYGTSAAVSMWTERGIEVGYVLATAGGAGPRRPPEEAREIRAKEQQTAWDIGGGDYQRSLDLREGEGGYCHELGATGAGGVRN